MANELSNKPMRTEIMGWTEKLFKGDKKGYVAETHV